MPALALRGFPDCAVGMGPLGRLCCCNLSSCCGQMGKPPHILILGGGVKRSSSMLTSFLSELLSSDHSQRSIDTGHFSDMPDVVLMSSHEVGAPNVPRAPQGGARASGHCQG